MGAGAGAGVGAGAGAGVGAGETVEDALIIKIPDPPDVEFA